MGSCLAAAESGTRKETARDVLDMAGCPQAIHRFI
jgi:hypothetical protein